MEERFEDDKRNVSFIDILKEKLNDNLYRVHVYTYRKWRKLKKKAELDLFQLGLFVSWKLFPFFFSYDVCESAFTQSTR
jgi:hypothetical protein